MNDVTWPLAIVGAWVLASVPFIWLAGRWFRAAGKRARREDAIQEALADPRLWEQLEADLRRQP